MLTPRQLEVAALLAQGMSYKAIGRQLEISTRTVEEHVHQAAARIVGLQVRPRDVVILWYVRVHIPSHAA